MSQHGLSVVIPVFNKEASLHELIERLLLLFQSESREAEIILVNDGSADRSWEIIESLAEANACVRGLELMRNYGQHNALLCGIRVARYDVIVTMDDDLQNPPEEVPRLLRKLAEGYDVVYGTPRRQTHGVFRNMASWLTKLALQSAMGVATARNLSAFRVFRAHLREAFVNYSGHYVSIDVC
jgi:glycosyltransferase involved in cell wall biosynthesis